MKISNHIYRYKSDTSSCNTYLVLNDFGVLIDPGTTLHRRFQKIQTQIKKDGIDISRLKQIWLTHCHPDHSQAANIWAKALDLKILGHSEAKMILEADNPLLALINREIKVAGKYHRKLISAFDLYIVTLASDFIYGKWEATKVERCFVNNEIINNGSLEVEIIFPSCHAPDDTCFLIKEDKAIISGDLFDTNRGNPFSPVLIFPSADLNHCLKIINRIIDLEPEIFLPGHGNPIIGKQKIIDYLQKILEVSQVYKRKTLEFLRQKPKATFYELGKNLEIRRNVSAAVFTAHSTLSILGFVVVKALKEDGLIT